MTRGGRAAATRRGDEYPARLGLELLLRLLERLSAQRAQLVLALQENLLAKLLPDFLAIELGHALEPLAHGLGKVADRVARLPYRGALAVQALLALLQLKVEEAERLLVGLDLAKPDVRLDLPPVEFAVELRALFLDLRLGLLPELPRPDDSLAPRHLDELRRLLVGRAARESVDHPHDGDPDQHPRQEGRWERRVKEAACEIGC